MPGLYDDVDVNLESEEIESVSILKIRILFVLITFPHNVLTNNTNFSIWLICSFGRISFLCNPLS